jgi:hypothetical protein
MGMPLQNVWMSRLGKASFSVAGRCGRDIILYICGRRAKKPIFAFDGGCAWRQRDRFPVFNWVEEIRRVQAANKIFVGLEAMKDWGMGIGPVSREIDFRCCFAVLSKSTSVARGPNEGSYPATGNIRNQPPGKFVEL